MEYLLLKILISLGIYLIIALSLILIDGKANTIDTNNLKFNELAIDYSLIPSLSDYVCRDGKSLEYRYYPSNSKKVLVLLHGSGWHSTYFLPLAKYISSNNIASVYTPDLRGHGRNPFKRGDISYINQLEDDLADFIEHIKKKDPDIKIIIGGHSSGGGLALRFAGSDYGSVADAYLLLSPFLKYNAPTIRRNSGGWASPHMARIIGLSMLNNLGITLLNKLNVIDFNMPLSYRDGTETLSYSFRLNTGFAPRNYKKDLVKIKQKLFVAVGSADESFIADAFKPEIIKYKKDATITVLEGMTHMGIVMGEEIRPVIKAWIDDVS